ncbi:bifunctional heptose 7-phosphate kinase/heptose 1-phosphate adenyltransferase [Catalinimonas niigatensis]|uniref:bifunctional heptose 7-phosphate kinase/heptose 1-phosphate adenyltransferase n=1 Tax=Catalinimonas niigatensis TaxID=1397264 RepID=UPI0026650EA3|nr:bifunctional ADP-heptose synthase [Catalinimonas niigatensis]WPP47957.1 bifunctional ADP-heptose synthase [Catalinimonas niigatensis]
MAKSLDEIFDSFRQLKVLIVGDVMLDAYIWGKVERISPEAPVPIVHVRKREKRLGGAANVALNVQALGAIPMICAVVGDDPAGQDFLSLLQEQKISTQGIVKSSSRVTTVKERVIAGSQQMLRVDSEDDELLNDTDREALYEVVQEAMQEADVVIFQDYDKGVLSEKLIQQTITLANQRGIPTAVDPKRRNFLHYRKATFFKPNLKELREGLQAENLDLLKEKHETALTPEQAVMEASTRLKELMEVETTFITMSERGVYIDAIHQGKEEKHVIPAHIRQISDVSGAGDTVISIAALCLALGLAPRLLAELANLGGGIVCEYTGVVSIQRERLLQEAKHVLNNPSFT